MAKPHTQTCPIAGFLNMFGDAWSLLIVREGFYGATRFSEFQRNTGIAKNLLSERLDSLVEQGIFEREDIGQHGTRFAYQLTDKAQSLVPVIVAMIQWADEHIYGEKRAPVRLIERSSLKPIPAMRPISADGTELKWGDILVAPGLGANRAARLRIGESNHGTSDESWIDSRN